MVTGTRILAHRTARLVAVGEFDRDNRHRIVLAVRRTLADGCPHITIDFSGVTLIDAGVIRSLLACRTQARAHGGDLRILRANGVVEFALEATGAESLLG